MTWRVEKRVGFYSDLIWDDWGDDRQKLVAEAHQEGVADQIVNAQAELAAARAQADELSEEVQRLQTGPYDVGYLRGQEGARAAIETARAQVAALEGERDDWKARTERRDRIYEQDTAGIQRRDDRIDALARENKRLRAGIIQPWPAGGVMCVVCQGWGTVMTTVEHRACALTSEAIAALASAVAVDEPKPITDHPFEPWHPTDPHLCGVCAQCSELRDRHQTVAVEEVVS